MEEQKKAEPKKVLDLEEFFNQLEGGLVELIPDEELRKRVAGWIKIRTSELMMVVVQQSKAIESLSLVLDDVLSQLRRWGWSADKGWMRARTIVNSVLTSFNQRRKKDVEKSVAAGSGDKSQESSFAFGHNSGGTEKNEGVPS